MLTLYSTPYIDARMIYSVRVSDTDNAYSIIIPNTEGQVGGGSERDLDYLRGKLMTSNELCQLFATF